MYHTVHESVCICFYYTHKGILLEAKTLIPIVSVFAYFAYVTLASGIFFISQACFFHKFKSSKFEVVILDTGISVFYVKSLFDYKTSLYFLSTVYFLMGLGEVVAVFALNPFYCIHSHCSNVIVHTVQYNKYCRTLHGSSKIQLHCMFLWQQQYLTRLLHSLVRYFLAAQT